MSLTLWGQTVLDAYHITAGFRRISIGKSRKGGDNRTLNLPLTDRWAYQVQKLIEALLEAPGTADEKHALVIILEDLDRAVDRAFQQEERAALLRKVGLKGSIDVPREH